MQFLTSVVTWIGLGILLAVFIVAVVGCAPATFPRYVCFPVQTDRGPAMICSPLKETP